MANDLKTIWADISDESKTILTWWLKSYIWWNKKFPNKAQKIGITPKGFTWGSLDLTYMANQKKILATGGLHSQAYIDYYIIKNSPVPNKPNFKARVPAGYQDWSSTYMKLGEGNINEGVSVLDVAKKFVDMLQKKVDAYYTEHYPNIMKQADHNSMTLVKIKPGAKYVKIDVGDGGRFMLSGENFHLYFIKGYGTPDLRKDFGDIRKIIEKDFTFDGYSITKKGGSPTRYGYAGVVAEGAMSSLDLILKSIASKHNCVVKINPQGNNITFTAKKLMTQTEAMLIPQEFIKDINMEFDRTFKLVAVNTTPTDMQWKIKQNNYDAFLVMVLPKDKKFI